MILFYIVCGSLFVGGIVMCILDDGNLDGLLMGGLILSIFCGIALLVMPFVWHSSKISAEMINRQYGTSYTAKEMFWAGETIRENVEGYRIKIDGQ